jgi:hypothetical protein
VQHRLRRARRVLQPVPRPVPLLVPLLVPPPVPRRHHDRSPTW